MQFKTITSPHQAGKISISNIMLYVMLALIPGTIAMIYYFGWGVLINILLASIMALFSEAFVLLIRKRAILNTLKDNSALITAWLLALALPPLAPWWLTITATGFAIIIGKQIYGGLGYNPFNPAMIGYVIVLISFPLEMTQWPLPIPINQNPLDFFAAINIIFSDISFIQNWDAISGATPLDTLKIQLGLEKTIPEISIAPIFGHLGGYGWEWIACGFLSGGLWLLYKRAITWHAPFSLLASLFIIASIFYLINPNQYPAPGFHLFSGGIMLAAFFIATDPVSSCTSNKGKLYFGAGIGILIYIIRTWGGYPDGIAFAVLLMNMSAPFIDYYTKPKVFGAQ